MFSNLTRVSEITELLSKLADASFVFPSSDITIY